MLDKSKIAQSFSRAAPSYDSHAQLQRDIGDALFARARLAKDALTDDARILDLGTGTGHYVPELQSLSTSPNNPIYTADLALGMLVHNQTKQKSLATCCDAENLPFAPQSFDLIFSNLALQWCYDLPKLFSELKRVSRGQVYLSTLLPGTLGELAKSWAAVDADQHVNRFLDASQWIAAAEAAGFKVEAEQQVFTMRYGEPITLLKELRSLGAHNVEAKPVSRSKLNTMLNHYKTNFSAAGLCLASYQTLFLTLKN